MFLSVYVYVYLSVYVSLNMYVRLYIHRYVSLILSVICRYARPYVHLYMYHTYVKFYIHAYVSVFVILTYQCRMPNLVFAPYDLCSNSIGFIIIHHSLYLVSIVNFHLSHCLLYFQHLFFSVLASCHAALKKSKSSPVISHNTETKVMYIKI